MKRFELKLSKIKKVTQYSNGRKNLLMLFIMTEYTIFILIANSNSVDKCNIISVKIYVTRNNEWNNIKFNIIVNINRRRNLIVKKKKNDAKKKAGLSTPFIRVTKFFSAVFQINFGFIFYFLNRSSDRRSKKNNRVLQRRLSSNFLTLIVIHYYDFVTLKTPVM